MIFDGHDMNRVLAIGWRFNKSLIEIIWSKLRIHDRIEVMNPEDTKWKDR